MRNRISPATIIASVALFFSLCGTGFAVTRYVITSTSQIAPKVRMALRGHTGSQGPAGPQGTLGATGPQGPAGEQGPEGPQGSTASISPSISWGTAYVVTSPQVDLTPDAPEATVTVSCRTFYTAPHAITGGFQGAGEIVTSTNLAGDRSDSWTVTAHLDPSASSGSVEAWVYCNPGGHRASRSSS